MKEKRIPRRILQYMAGLICMAVGIVLLKRTNWGISPITAVPDALSNILPLTIGNLTIIMHAVCVLIQILLQKKITLKSLLCLGVGIPFGYLVDLFMLLWNPVLVLWSKIVSLILGIMIQGFGVALISGCDMILPAPDEMNNLISRLYDKKLGNIKMITDLIYVVLALIINLFTYLFARDRFALSVGINSVASVLLTGRFVNLTFKLLPRLRMDPLFKI
ncbi:MAG: hypothetical protein E7233_06695 [Lachnospiraceae bacterium]|nr:hypothetical protein [Lachnospiraceae bacterium]